MSLYSSYCQFESYQEISPKEIVSREAHVPGSYNDYTSYIAYSKQDNVSLELNMNV